jgi:hypothetical protein
MPIQAIIALISLGGDIAAGLTDDKTAQKWIQLGKLAAEGVSSAVDAVQKLKEWAETGYVPTNDELDAVYADSVAAHQKVQDA